VQLLELNEGMIVSMLRGHLKHPSRHEMFAVYSVDEWLTSFEVRILPFVNLKITLEEEEIVKLGKKNEDEYPSTARFISLFHDDVGTFTAT